MASCTMETLRDVKCPANYLKKLFSKASWRSVFSIIKPGKWSVNLEFFPLSFPNIYGLQTCLVNSFWLGIIYILKIIAQTKNFTLLDRSVPVPSQNGDRLGILPLGTCWKTGYGVLWVKINWLIINFPSFISHMQLTKQLEEELITISSVSFITPDQFGALRYNAYILNLGSDEFWYNLFLESGTLCPRSLWHCQFQTNCKCWR